MQERCANVWERCELDRCIQDADATAATKRKMASFEEEKRHALKKKEDRRLIFIKAER